MTPRDLVREARRRRAAYPLAYATLWDNPEPRTSQRRALRLGADPSVIMLSLLGGNKTGKSQALAMWLSAHALGLDYAVEEARGVVHPVRQWCARNGLPESMLQARPGHAWVASPAFGPACEQIRPKIRSYLPGARFIRWDQPNEAEVRTVNGGKITSKAYKQYDQDPQTWEGAAPSVLGLDEQPNSYGCLTAGLSRLMESPIHAVRCLCALTPLRGRADWYYQELVAKPVEWHRRVWLHGEDNPHIDQAQRRAIIAAFPAWQRAARDLGEFAQPEGAVFPELDAAAHIVPRFALPPGALRWFGADWGENAPHGVWAIEIHEEIELPDGRRLQSGDMVVYREVAPRREQGQAAIPTPRFIAMCRDAERGHPEGLGQCVVLRVGDSGNVGNDEALLEAARQGWMIAPAQKPNGSIATGLELLRSLLATVDPVDQATPQRPRLYFVEDAAPVLWDELQSMRWGPPIAGQEPLPDPRCPDHGVDALRYLALYRRSSGR